MQAGARSVGRDWEGVGWLTGRPRVGSQQCAGGFSRAHFTGKLRLVLLPAWQSWSISQRWAARGG